MFNTNTSSKALGKHFLLELNQCEPGILRDLRKIETILVTAAKKANATIVESRFHQFSPFGISGLVVIAESHFTIHTWPEHAYAAVDIFTCGDGLNPHLACTHLVTQLKSKRPSVVEIMRGIFSKEGVPGDYIAVNEGNELKNVPAKFPQMVF